jgi:creatinine amidohydrolase
MTDGWDLSATSLLELRERTYEVAVLPLAATEAHNFHLPEGQDVLATNHVARRICAAAWGKGAGVLCLPGLPYGVDCNLAAFPISIHVSQATLDQMIREIITSLHHFGIRKVVLLNGHGGNDFVPLIRQIQSDLPVHVFLSNWWTVVNDRWAEFFSVPDDHAGEMETSVALALYPELVRLEKAASGAVRPFRFEALRKGWVRTSRDFSRLNDHAAVGDPRASTADKGRRFLDAVCARLVDFLVELAETPIDERFPHA